MTERLRLIETLVMQLYLNVAERYCACFTSRSPVFTSHSSDAESSCKSWGERISIEFAPTLIPL
jgi:hypothetical protein